MPPTYYVIELSARWLTALLVALALALVMAFAFGYGAAWSVLSSAPAPTGTEEPAAAASSEIEEAEVVDTAPVVTPSMATPVPQPTDIPTPQAVAAPDTPSPTPTAPPRPTATATPRPQPVRAVDQVFWVQVVAASNQKAMAEARSKLVELGFPADNQRVVSSPVAGGRTLYKMRIGPFPDRNSADRVVRRMQESGFPDAWVVAP
jgi:cell division septation protein DedD